MSGAGVAGLENSREEISAEPDEPRERSVVQSGFSKNILFWRAS
jgi:hypothetical protein